MTFIEITKQMIMQKSRLLFVSFGLVIFIGITGISSSYAVYELPNDNGNCPANCRQIPWQAGSDQWNGGTLPIYTPVTCTGLTEGDGTNDNGAAIQSCINNASVGTAVFIPAGIYYVDTALTMKSGVVLRGSGGGSPWLPDTSNGTTTLKLGPNGYVRLGTLSIERELERSIASGYTKGSTTLEMTSGHGFVQNDWISVFEDGDSEIPTTATGDAGTCDWCGENNGSNLIQQFVQVTSVNGNIITISRPLYYTYKTENNPGAKKVTWNIAYAGIENIKLHGWSEARDEPFIYMRGALFCWVNGVETYNAPSVSKATHITFEWSHGGEIRDSYLHDGRDNSGDKNYGIAFFFWNSDHKIENNILRHHRHSLAFEGGGSGVAILYNYIDDNYTDDLLYLGSARVNHGAHPIFNLYEGNHISHLEADDVWGSSSHIVFFRNYLRGGETGIGVPGYPPEIGLWAIHVNRLNVYYSAVGNVLGEPSWTSSDLLRITQSSHCDSDDRTAYAYGCSDGVFYERPLSTAINHGNYDYVTDSVAYWEGGSDHVLKSSMYYSSKPAFFGSCSWPVFGPDLNPITGILPAKNTYDGQSACTNGSSSSLMPPTNLETVR